MTTIALIDDNTLLVEQFKKHFDQHKTIQVVTAASTIEAFEKSLGKTPSVNILFLDIAMPNESGIEALPRLKQLLPNTDIIMFTVNEDRDSLFKALCHGAAGYVLKSSGIEYLESYIDIVQKGGSAISATMAQKLIENVCLNQKTLEILNEKEYQILELLAEGWSYKLIADRVDMSVDGVRFYIKRIYRALNVNSKGEAVYKFFSQNKQS